MTKRGFFGALAGSLLASVLLLAGGAAKAIPFDIAINFTGGLTGSQQAVFTTAATYWESVITGYDLTVPLPLTFSGSVQINAAGVPIDGVNGVLGSAGVDSVFLRQGSVYASSGSMSFDTADLAALELNNGLLDVILHEIAHVLGFGSLWTSNGVYTAGSGAYTGANALAECLDAFGATCSTFVPVELDGGSGTVDAHWDEVAFGSELMTGFINGATYISDMSICSFADIGYTVGVECGAPTTSVTLESGTLALFGVGFIGLGLAARYRR